MYIKAATLPDAWFQAVWNLLEWCSKTDKPKNGRLWKIDQGSYEGIYRLEYPFITIEIANPTLYPLLPEMPESLHLPPIATMEYVSEYFDSYFMSNNIPENTEYTYGSRIQTLINKTSQLDILLQRLEKHPYSNQLVLHIASPEDIGLKDPPCLQSICLKVIDNQLDMHIYFRSNDLINGFPVNLACIALFMEYITTLYPQFSPGKFYYFSSGLHIYDHAFEYACMRCYKSKELKNLQLKIKS
jgi:hypothetical protein